MTNTLNIFRSDRSNCWKGDLEDALEVYSNQELAAIREHGFTAIWVHQKLSDYTPSRVLPGFGQDSERYLDILRRLIARAAQHSLQVYMYLLEPRALEISDPFWQENLDLRGQYWKQPVYNREYYALCSSHPKVQEYLFNSISLTARELPGLGGFFAITAGEDFSTCCCKLWNAQAWKDSVGKGPKMSSMERDLTCPRCASRPIFEPIAEVMNIFQRAIKSVNSPCQLLAWDWGWERLPGEKTEREIIERLDPGITLLSDFEIGGSKMVMGQERYVDEYSLGYVGPSPRFEEKFRLAKAGNRRIAAKLQVGTTHELCTVPNLPFLNNLYSKLKWLNENNINAALATWNMGNMRTLNTYVFGNSFGKGAAFNRILFYEKLIPEYLDVSPGEIPTLEKAWSCFENAMSFFPYGGKLFLYMGPVNYGPSYWLPPRQTGGTSLGISCDVLERGDDLKACFGNYSGAQIIECFRQIVREWDKGLLIYEKVLGKYSSERARQELRSAQCARLVFLSSLHIFRAFALCDQWSPDKISAYLEICREERSNCLELIQLLRIDSRLGFHPECQQYMFDEKAIMAKIRKIDEYLGAHSDSRELETKSASVDSERTSDAELVT